MAAVIARAAEYRVTPVVEAPTQYLGNGNYAVVDTSGKNSVATMVHRPLLVKPHHKNQVTAEIANRDGRTVLFARTQLGRLKALYTINPPDLSKVRSTTTPLAP